MPLTGRTANTAARTSFDRAVAVLSTDTAAAYRLFREATESDPAMADAWLGRLATGDDDVHTLEQLVAVGARLHREFNRVGSKTVAAVAKTGPYLSISITELAHAGIALASALIDSGQFDRAQHILNDSLLLDAPEAHQWRQYLAAYLMFAAQRWPDVLTEGARQLPAEAVEMAPVAAAIGVLAAHASVHLGQGRLALDWAGRVPEVDQQQFPLINADLAFVRGMAHRQLGDEDAAQSWLSKAVVNGVLLHAAKEALCDPALQLTVTDEETIASRTNKWDATTAQTEESRAEAQRGERRTELLTEGRALLESQVGLEEVKRAVTELEDQIQIRALRLASGLPVTDQTNHMLLVGPPGTGKTTTAEALGKIFAGLGVVRHPEIIEVKRADFCGEHIGSSGPKTNELITQSLGRILFCDELYSLVERHHDGRPDMIGMEAVHQLMVALEVHRFDFCFIGAGYEKEIDDFLTVNPGLAGRFNRKLRFESYSPTDLVEIAIRYGRPRATVMEPQARDAFHDACRQLRSHMGADGTHGIDLMQNGRFARNVVERAERSRDSRVAAQHRRDAGSVTIEDLQTLRSHDVLTAVAGACAEKHIPFTCHASSLR